jgi:hypothetical protein
LLATMRSKAILFSAPAFIASCGSCRRSAPDFALAHFPA